VKPKQNFPTKNQQNEKVSEKFPTKIQSIKRKSDREFSDQKSTKRKSNGNFRPKFNKNHFIKNRKSTSEATQ